MSQTSVTVHGWLPAEDDLLLQYFHISHPGGRSEEPMECVRWLTISENMTRTAPAIGLRGSYSPELCAKRYTTYILPRMTLAAAQNRPGRVQDLADSLNCYNPYEGVLEWIGGTQLAEGNAPSPGETTLGNFVTWEYLVNWAIRIQEYPSQIFIEPGKFLEFDANPEVQAAQENKMGIRAQYDLDYFNEMLGWARSIVRQSGREEE